MGKRKLPPAFSREGFKDEDIMCLSFDTETDDLGGDLLFITAHDDKTCHEFEGEAMVHEFFTLMAEFPYPYVWYAHNAQYDWRYFLDYIRDNGLICFISMRTETDIYQITVIIDNAEGQNVRVVMRDSLAVFPGTLKELGKTFTPELPKGDLNFETERFDPSNSAHRAYARRDATLLRYAMPRFDGLCRRHFGVSLGHTTAGTGLKAWMATLAPGEFYTPSTWDEREQFVREGYYGGLVFLTDTAPLFNADEPCAYTIDRNSSYPAVMCEHGVPYGRCIETTDYLSGKMGIYRVRISAPDDLIIPIIPRRNDRGYMRWHRGEFETVVTSSELIFAVSQGYTVHDVIEGLAWEDRVFPFNAFIDKCKELRYSYPDGSPENRLGKLLQNSVYGKYGSRRERMKVFVPLSDEEKIDALPLDESGYFWSRKEFSETLRCLPSWAVFITAHARLELLRTAYSIGPEYCLYGDTDSITFRAGVDLGSLDIGALYGQWKLEKQWRSFRAIAPKVYTGQLTDGRWKGAAKGLPRKVMDEKAWNALWEGERVRAHFRSLPSLRVAMKNGIAPAHDASRISTDINNSENWELIGTKIRPRIAA